MLRLNTQLGLPDAFFLLGEEVLVDVTDRLNVMPFLIFAAKLCPADVEGSMFALFMGLFNFGSSAGRWRDGPSSCLISSHPGLVNLRLSCSRYLGSGLLNVPQGQLHTLHTLHTRRYLGSGLLDAMGGVAKPDYDGLPAFVAVRSLMRLLPVLLVPWLVPPGSPSSSVEDMQEQSSRCLLFHLS